MKKIKVVLSGLTPLLMHNVESMISESEDLAKAGPRKYIPEEEAKKSAYTTQIKGKTVLCVPSRCVYGMILHSASFFKVKGRNVQSTIAGAIDVTPEDIPLTLGGKFITNYVIDKRSVVVQKARIIRCRPRIDKWELGFELVYNEDYIADDKLLKKIIQDGGVKVGLLNFRPEKKGRFGKFELKSWG
jgi:hypothetical protein